MDKNKKHKPPLNSNYLSVDRLETKWRKKGSSKGIEHSLTSSIQSDSKSFELSNAINNSKLSKVVPKQGSFVSRPGDRIDSFQDLTLIEDDGVSQNIFSKLEWEDSESGIINLWANFGKTRQSNANVVNTKQSATVNNYLVTNPLEDSNFSFN